jgi:dihydrodipicolinate synthase/N-acetylneuraminate lyase
LSSDSGIDPIIPYIVAVIRKHTDRVSQLDDLSCLWRLLWAAAAIGRNSGSSVSANLAPLLSALNTLLLTKRIGKPGAFSWACDCMHV